MSIPFNSNSYVCLTIFNINVSTHVAGNTLDAVLTKDYDNKFIGNIDVIEDNGTSSDHYLITFDVSVSCLWKPTPSKIVTFKDYSNFDLEAFVQAINSSDLCNHSKFKSLGHDLVLYDTVLNSLLNTHAPLGTKRVKTGAAKWWNSKCQQACQKQRQAEQKHKCLKTLEQSLY